MKIPRMSMITLGVADLDRATTFYEQVLATSPNTSHDGVRFIELPGVWLSLYPLDRLAEDVASGLPAARSAFPGFTLAHNARSEGEVRAICERARSAGARIMTEPESTFWGGFHGYFADPDGYFWEIAYGAMFDSDAHGDMRWKA
ncbi:MAG: VOC family protein [Burkholderiales bacterium]|nr:VOC family protein [Burkholderiales bacterium]